MPCCLSEDNERYAVAVTPSATITTACLIGDEQAEACNAISLLCNRGSRLDAICLSDMVGDGGLAASIALLTSCHIETSHTIHQREVDDNRTTRGSRVRPIARRGKSGE
jgi:hypothetical protein